MKRGQRRNRFSFRYANIDEKAFESISSFIEYAESASETRIVYGGHRDKSTSYFIGPTVVQTNDPHNRLMAEEIFGPVLTVYVYPENQFEETLRLCDGTTPYGLTGAIVGQQLFGGARGSGTNDKAGTPHHLMRWVSPRTVKENFLPLPSFRYPFMEEP